MRLDVIIPTFNRAGSLARTLDSLQSAPVPAGMSVTITVVDNNCTDGTEALVASRMHNDDRVRHVFERQQGRSPALNAGVASTSGDLVGMVDDDEEVDATWYEVIEEAFSDPKLDFIGGPYIPRWVTPPPPWLPKEYGGVVGWVDGGDREVPYDSSYDGVLMGGNAVIRRRVMERVGPYATSLGRTGTRLLSGEDRDYYYRGRTLHQGILSPVVVLAWGIARRIGHARRLYRPDAPACPALALQERCQGASAGGQEVRHAD
jgi:glycosyltransferase involved in cell wall biosynthesis